MPRTQSQLVTILQLNRGPSVAVATELAPYLGASHFGSQLRAILVGEIRRNLREAIGDAAWQFGATEGPWFSEHGERLADQGQSDQILDVGTELFQKWLTTGPDGSLASDELHKVVLAAVKRIEKLPVPPRPQNASFFGRNTNHQTTVPLLGAGEIGAMANINAKSSLASQAVETAEIADDEGFAPSSFQDMIALARKSSIANAGKVDLETQSSIEPRQAANDSIGRVQNWADATPTQLMPMTGLPPFPFFDMSTLDEVV